MENRVYNFAAGPSMLADEVLVRIQSELLNYHNSGMSVMEMSHRAKDYLQIFNETKDLLRKVMNIPENYEIMFIQGGATQQFGTIPLNLLKGGKADYIVTGVFSGKSAQEASKFGEIHVAYDDKDNGYRHIPTQDELNLSDESSYVHLCTNNTIYGTEWKYTPDTKGVPIVADMSSNILSKPVNVSDFGLIYAGAQKNMGIAGCAVVIARKDLIEDHQDNIPVLMEYNTMAKSDSMYNTPPTFSIYVLGCVLKWIDDLGGLEVMQERNEKKAKLLYDYLDQSEFYKPRANQDSRSLMNVTFTTPTPELDAKFCSEAAKVGMTNLKGHRLSGGIRASIYNAMPYEGVECLVNFMKKFEGENK